MPVSELVSTWGFVVWFRHVATAHHNCIILWKASIFSQYQTDIKFTKSGISVPNILAMGKGSEHPLTLKMVNNYQIFNTSYVGNLK